MKSVRSSLFLIFLLCSAPVSHAEGREIPNPGPRSDQEAKFLFEDAQNEIAKQNIPAAVRDLERLVQRYPRDSQFKSAQEQLISLYLSQKNAAGAVRTAKAYLLQDSTSESAQSVRAKLVEAYFLQGKNLEARATARELLKRSKTDSTKARALMTLARVDANEKKWNEARAKLDALPAPVSAQDRDSLLLEIGTKECMEAKAPSKKIKKDDPWIEYFDRKNFCLKSVAAGHGSTASDVSHKIWCDAFEKLSNALDASDINAYQKSRLIAEFNKTREIAAPLECEKAHEPQSKK